MDEQQNTTPQVTDVPEQTPAPEGKNPNLHAALSYLLGPVTGVIFLLIEKENEYVRFHAAQSTIVFGLLWVIGFIPILNLLSIIIWIIIWPITLILWVVLMYKAYSGERFMLPIVGEYAEKLEKAV